MKNVKSTPALLLYMVVGLIAALVINGCGSGGSSGSSTSSSTSASSISDLPEVSTMVNGGSTSSSESAPLKSLGKAVSGTPPLLIEINSEADADSYFWGGLVAEINAGGTPTPTQVENFWKGEGSCRMGQTVGYAFQNLLQAGASLCYMQNIPGAANGVTVVSGDITSSNVFNQTSSSKIVKVNVTNMPGGDGDQGSSQTVFIKVFGTGTSEGSPGYAADLWFCSAGSVGGYETIRYASSTGTLTQTTVDASHGGNFAAIITGSLTSSGGQLIYDSTKTQSGTVYFGGSEGGTFLGAVTVDGSRLTASNYNSFSYGGLSQTFIAKIFADYSGTTMANLRFSQAGFAIQNTTATGGAFSHTGGTEFQNTRYVAVESGSLVSLAEASDALTGGIFSGSTSTYTALLAARTSYSCSTTADAEVNVDMGQSATSAIASHCEVGFTNMNFCDGSTISSARNKVMSAQVSQVGSCSTNAFCSDDFSCQKWVDRENEENGTNIPVTSYTCQNGCCAQ